MAQNPLKQSILAKKKGSRFSIKIYYLILAEDMGLEPTGLLHLTAFPMQLLSHSVNPPNRKC